ncbi:MAG TPA: DUF3800 domain-containing protein [Terriglobales bacterium]|nr:DUF3800 domain-containing protein [Terriglobales bacterium]
MYLTYLDDAGTDKHSPIAMFGAVIVFPDTFGQLEGLHSTAIQQMLPVEDIENKFQEFHASELHNGTGAFEGMEEDKRFGAIRVLLTCMKMEKFPYIYAAVDRKKLAKGPGGSASPVDVAFRMCALGVEDWARSKHARRDGAIIVDFKDMCLFIADDTKDGQLKNQLRASYRSLRKARPLIPPIDNRLWHAHDDLYFGDSRDSIGIQMADLCNYFMWLHLTGKEDEQGFYKMFSGQAICAKPEPEWTTYHDWFRTHDGEESKPMVDSQHDANAKSQAAR